jgi:hypothetical protein
MCWRCEEDRSLRRRDSGHTLHYCMRSFSARPRRLGGGRSNTPRATTACSGLDSNSYPNSDPASAPPTHPPPPPPSPPPHTPARAHTRKRTPTRTRQRTHTHAHNSHPASARRTLTSTRKAHTKTNKHKTSIYSRKRTIEARSASVSTSLMRDKWAAAKH